MTARTDAKDRALNPKSKLTLESGTNPTNRNTRSCLTYVTDTHNKARCQL